MATLCQPAVGPRKTGRGPQQEHVVLYAKWEAFLTQTHSCGLLSRQQRIKVANPGATFQHSGTIILCTVVAERCRGGGRWSADQDGACRTVRSRSLSRWERQMKRERREKERERGNQQPTALSSLRCGHRLRKSLGTHWALAQQTSNGQHNVHRTTRHGNVYFRMTTCGCTCVCVRLAACVCVGNTLAFRCSHKQNGFRTAPALQFLQQNLVYLCSSTGHRVAISEPGEEERKIASSWLPAACSKPAQEAKGTASTQHGFKTSSPSTQSVSSNCARNACANKLIYLCVFFLGGGR